KSIPRAPLSHGRPSGEPKSGSIRPSSDVSLFQECSLLSIERFQRRQVAENGLNRTGPKAALGKGFQGGFGSCIRGRNIPYTRPHATSSRSSQAATRPRDSDLKNTPAIK